jgi:hypothetical protein
MSNVNVTQFIEAPVDTVWKLVGAPEKLADWHPAIAQSQLDGSSRTCLLADGAEIREEITARDEVGRHYTYRILVSPLPMSNYVSTLRVVERDRGCEVRWESEFQPEGIPAGELEAMIRGLYESGLAALGQHFTAA